MPFGSEGEITIDRNLIRTPFILIQGSAEVDSKNRTYSRGSIESEMLHVEEYGQRITQKGGYHSDGHHWISINNEIITGSAWCLMNTTFPVCPHEQNLVLTMCHALNWQGDGYVQFGDFWLVNESAKNKTKSQQGNTRSWVLYSVLYWLVSHGQPNIEEWTEVWAQGIRLD